MEYTIDRAEAFKEMNAVVQYRLKGMNRWDTIAAFDMHVAAVKYAGECETYNPGKGEYRAVKVKGK